MAWYLGNVRDARSRRVVILYNHLVSIVDRVDGHGKGV